MTTIRVACPTCGAVEVPATWFRVVRYTATGNGWCTFLCPSCQEWVTKEPTPGLMELLVSRGIPTCTVTPPAELDDAGRHTGASPIGWDDLLEFHLLLATARWRGWRRRLAPGRAGNAGASASAA